MKHPANQSAHNESAEVEAAEHYEKVLEDAFVLADPPASADPTEIVTGQTRLWADPPRDRRCCRTISRINANSGTRCTPEALKAVTQAGASIK